MSRVFSLRERKVRIIGVFVISAIFILSVGGTFYQLTQERTKAVALLRTTDWLLVQVQREVLRFQSAINLYAEKKNQAAKDLLQLRYEILLSRFEVALNGPEGHAVRRIEKVAEQLKASQQRFLEDEPLLAALAPTNTGAIESLRELTETQERLLNRIAQTMMANSKSDAFRDFGKKQSETSFYVAIMCVAGVVLIVLLWREIQRSHHHADLEHLARIRAETESRAKTNFLAHMSHELRTPLNAIIGYSEIMDQELLGPLGNEKYREYAKDITFAGGHLRDLIGDILDISKIEAESYQLHDERANLHSLLVSSLRLCKLQADEKNVALTLVSEFRRDVYLDPLAIKQVIVNLISNAVRFSPRNGSVFMGLQTRADAGLTLFVQDQGPGVESDKMEKLFEPFDSLEATTTKGESSGLGLYISSRLLELHGGRISASNGEKGGAVFSIELPAERCFDSSEAVA